MTDHIGPMLGDNPTDHELGISGKKRRLYTQADLDAAVLDEKMLVMDWCGKRVGVIQRAWKRAAEKALNGDLTDLRTRVQMMDAPPLDIVQSATRAALGEKKE